MAPSYNSKAKLDTACRKSLLHTVVNTTIYRLTNIKPVFSLHQQQDEFGIGLYGLSLWCSQSRRFTKAVCYFLSSVIFYVVLPPRHLRTLIFPALSTWAMCHRNDFKVPLNVNANKFLFSWFAPERDSSRRDSRGRALLNAKLNAQVDACVVFFYFLPFLVFHYPSSYFTVFFSMFSCQNLAFHSNDTRICWVFCEFRSDLQLYTGRTDYFTRMTRAIMQFC